MKASRNFPKRGPDHSAFTLRAGLLTEYAEQAVCFWCGERFGSGDRKKTREHLIPRSAGGGDSWPNIVAAHKSCNQRRGCRMFPVPFHVHGVPGKLVLSPRRMKG